MAQSKDVGSCGLPLDKFCIVRQGAPGACVAAAAIRRRPAALIFLPRVEAREVFVAPLTFAHRAF